LESRGAEVRIFADADNCVRRREPGEPMAPDRPNPSLAANFPFVIEVQGVPNLFHELAHVVLLGRVDKDHGTRAAEIPFDLTRDEGRRLLFEELACCVASASWHPEGNAEPDADAASAADRWFAEQVGIQDCFFGMQGDLPRFLAAVEREVLAHRGELDEVIARAHERVSAALAEAGAPATLASPKRRYGFDRGWRWMRGR